MCNQVEVGTSVLDDDGTGFSIGERVFVSDPYSEFYGAYIGLTPNGELLKVRDEDTAEVMLGSIDYVSPAREVEV